MRITAGISLLLVACSAAWGANVAQPPDAASPQRLVVAVRHVPPFAMQSEEGNWSGIAIDLLEGIVAEMESAAGSSIALELRPMSLRQMLDAVESGRVDLAASALTVSLDREQRMDFSHAFHTSGLGIAVKRDTRSGWLLVLERVFSATFVKIVSALVGLLLISGLLVYAVERHPNREQFGGSFWRGLGAGVWWSIVTLTTVGYGDKAPKTLVGRSIAVLWMVSGILLFSAFTAAVTSALTLGQLRSRVSGPNDLPRVRVGTIEVSTSQAYLRSRRLRHRSFSELAPALTALQAGDIDAVVYDAPLLRYRVLQEFPELAVLPSTFERQDYAIAMPHDSPLREQVNLAVLRIISRPTWDDTLADYLGEVGP